MCQAFNYVGFTGRLVWVGLSTQPLSFTQTLMHRREMTLFTSRNALAPDFTRIIQLIEDGRIDTRPWITHRAGFEDMIGQFPNWLKPDAGVIKAVVTVD
jgi:alcohol dehydrogenase